MFKDSVIVTGESTYQPRMRVTMDNLDPTEEQHVSALDIDFSTDAPVIYFDTVCLGHSNVASSEVVLDKALPEELLGLSYALARGMGENGDLHPQSYQIQSTVWRNKTEIHFMHRGGKYIYFLIEKRLRISAEKDSENRTCITTQIIDTQCITAIISRCRNS